MRINNLSARLLANEWLQKHGYETIPGDRSYLDFATELRSIVAVKLEKPPFVDRKDATEYLRWFVGQHCRGAKQWDG